MQLWTNKKTRQGYSALMMAIRQGWRDCAYAILDLSKGRLYVRVLFILSSCINSAGDY